MMSEFSSLFFCNCNGGNLSWRDDSNECNEIIICHNYSPPLNVSVQFIDFPSRQLAKYTSSPVWPAAVVEIFFLWPRRQHRAGHGHNGDMTLVMGGQLHRF